MEELIKKREKNLNISNGLTISRIILSPIFFYFLARSNVLIGLTIFIFAALTDLVDGWYARLKKQETRFGMVADPYADKIMIAFAVASLIMRYGFPLYGLLIFTRGIVSLSGHIIIFLRERGIWKASKFGKLTTFMQVLTVIAFVINSPYKLGVLWLTIGASLSAASEYFITGIKILRGQKS